MKQFVSLHLLILTLIVLMISFQGNSVGTVSYYKNIGSSSNFIFQFITSQFAGIQIIGGADSPEKPPKMNASNDNPRHGASAITFSNITNTGKLDLYWGDFSAKCLQDKKYRNPAVIPVDNNRYFFTAAYSMDFCRF